MKKSIFFFFLLFSLPVFSQRVAIKNNLVYDALLTPNLSLEFWIALSSKQGEGSRFSVVLPVYKGG